MFVRVAFPRLAAMAVVLAVVGCGQVAPQASLAARSQVPTASQPVFGARDAEVGPEANMEVLNLQTDMDEIDEADLADLAAEQGDIMSPEATASEPQGKRMTRVGFIRSNEDGRFFLQIRKGSLWWKKEAAIPLAGRDEQGRLLLAQRLNSKVVVRGRLQGETLVTACIVRLPDFGAVWDLLSKGRMAGKVYDARSLVVLPLAEVTVRSFGNGRIWRARADRQGLFRIGRLEAGAYEVTARSADYRLGLRDKVTIRRRDTAQVLLALTPESVAQQPVPAQF
ncbi:MAG: carboxypeptidase-like regulatory domain-containing protein [Candidatus Sericytochromatia bacterium]|nr:carboxypeptidase-like regulatory domain-containing protein [Candidatus Sericytochromatia bacterium]